MGSSVLSCNISAHRTSRSSNKMKAAVLLLLIATPQVASLKQDPCAACDETLAQRYQQCVHDYGNPCAEENEKGLVVETGKKRDYGCCLKKEKHERCLKCNGMDCSHDSCSPHMNQDYYGERAKDMADKEKTKAAYKKSDAKAMKAAGWGL